MGTAAPSTSLRAGSRFSGRVSSTVGQSWQANQDVTDFTGNRKLYGCYLSLGAPRFAVFETWEARVVRLNSDRWHRTQIGALGSLRVLQGNEIAGRTEIVLVGLVNHADVAQFLRHGIGNNAVKFPQFRGRSPCSSRKQRTVAQRVSKYFENALDLEFLAADRALRT